MKSIQPHTECFLILIEELNLAFRVGHVRHVLKECVEVHILNLKLDQEKNMQLCNSLSRIKKFESASSTFMQGYYSHPIVIRTSILALEAEVVLLL